MEVQAKIKRLGIGILFIVLIMTITACSGNSKQEQQLRENGLEALENKNYSDAIAIFDEALDLRGTDKPGKLEIDILKYRAEAEFSAQDYAAADHTYSILIESDGERAEYLNMRTICISKSGDELTTALELYKKADAMKNPGAAHEESLYSLGTALVQSAQEDNINMAMQFYTDALSNESRQSAELYNRIGMLYFDKQDYDKALDYFSQGMTYVENNKKADTKNLEQSIYLSAEKAILFNQASCYEYKQQFEKALELFDSYIDKYGEDDNVRHEILFLESR